MNIDEIAETLLGELMQVHSDFKIDYEKRISTYKDKLHKEFIAGLTERQTRKRLYNAPIVVNVSSKLRLNKIL